MAEELQTSDPERIGPYRVVRRLGSGGMGQVFLARSAGGRLVAVKVVRADLAADHDFRARFRREVEAARKVSGLYTAMLVDADTDGPVPWLATAYVSGPSLADAVAERGPLAADAVRTLAAGLAESLAAIHAAGVIHRDLKPSNVLLADDGPRVIDFGISRATEASALTRTGLVVGSPGFMSPEQAEGFPVGPASDIFSLGAVLTFAATGQGPFGGGTTAALIYRVVHGAPMLAGLPAELRALVERCLAKEPGRRPTASDLLAELGDSGVNAGSPPASGQAPQASPDPRAHPETGAEPTRTQAPGPVAGAVLAPAATLAAPGGQAVYAVTFGPRGDLLAAAGGSGRVYLWDVARGVLGGAFADPGSRGVIGVAVDPDGGLLAAADGNGHVYLWDLVSGRLARTFAWKGSRGMNGVAFGFGGNLLAAADGNGQIHLWDVVSGKVMRTFTIPYSRAVYAVTFSPRGDLLAGADGNGQAYLWDLVRWMPVGGLAGPGSRGVNGVAFGPGGDVLAAADANGQVYVWDVGRGALAAVLASPGSRGVNGVAFGPDGALLAAADANGQVCVWDAHGGLASVLAGPGSRGVNGVAFGPRGDLLAAADGSGQVYLWQTSHLRRGG